MKNATNQDIFGIIIKNEDGTFDVTTDFSLTEEETQTILDILTNHVNEGGSSAGLDGEEMEEYLKNYRKAEYQKTSCRETQKGKVSMFEKKRKLAEALFDKENIIIYLQDEGNTVFFVADTDTVTPSDIVSTIRKEGVDVVETSIRPGYYATSQWLKYGYWLDLV